MEAGTTDIKATRRTAFCTYILSRLERMATDGDPVFDKLEELAESMGVPLEIRVAQALVHATFPPALAKAVELVLTGEAWNESGDQLTGGG